MVEIKLSLVRTEMKPGMQFLENLGICWSSAFSKAIQSLTNIGYISMLNKGTDIYFRLQKCNIIDGCT